MSLVDCVSEFMCRGNATHGMNPPISKPKTARMAKNCDLLLIAHCDALTIDHAQMMVGIHLPAKVSHDLVFA